MIIYNLDILQKILRGWQILDILLKSEIFKHDALFKGNFQTSFREEKEGLVLQEINLENAGETEILNMKTRKFS